MTLVEDYNLHVVCINQTACYIYGFGSRDQGIVSKFTQMLA